MARAGETRVEELRRQAFGHFDAQERAQGERVWAQFRARAAQVDLRYGESSQSLEAALALDPQRDQVRSLLELAAQLQGILVPVEPRANFRRSLHGDLILEAQRREVVPEPNMFQQHRKGILIGAAAVGSVASVVGVILAFVWRLRHGRATHTATG